MDKLRPHVVLSSAAAGPTLRWGTTASIATGTLSLLLVLSLLAPNVASRIVSLCIEFAGVAAIVVYIIMSIPHARYGLLKLLLKWKDWAYMPRSGWTRLYLGTVSYLGGQKPKLWELQGTLPSLPVPPLEQTLKNYLASVEPILTKDEFENTKKIVEEFKNSPASGQLQAMLIARSKTESTSWLLEWWESLVYLKGRLPLAVFSNWYGLDRVDPLLRSQVARAANLVNGLIQFKQMMDTQALEPNRVQGTVPLCMWQYSRIFGTVRIPGEEMDALETHSKSKHIIVISRGKFFKVEIYDQYGPLTPADIQIQFTRVLQQTETVNEAQQIPMAALTSQDRTSWAHHRKQLIDMDDVNKESLAAIETALFVMILADEEPTTVEEMTYHGMHRKGKSIWYDKNFNLMVMKNGRFCANVDHTWSDASVMVHVFDFVFSVESSVDHWVKTPTDDSLPHPKPLQWNLTSEFEANVHQAQAKLNQLAQSVELHVEKFQPYGKGLIKKFNMSPDAFCQIALQLAYYRMHERIVLAYESAATVRYHHGRTETVRSVSNESAKFVRMMADPNVTSAQKLAALQAAVKKQTRLMRAATNGDGVDRHLMGLRILAAATQTPAPIFEDPAYNLKFVLSTSQTPATATLGGGFAPIAEEGYGVSYVVAEDRLWFHISSYSAHPLTSSVKFGEALRSSLLDLQDVCFSDPKIQAKLSQRQFKIQRAE
eukprot:TRINITY_DN1290_c0_g1_i2.p1 TRINITY_DN1290_c0_g1~~TRINITY_DN1290_c0_g1_i2.p1  ORF type:complete len:712 (-),score=129.16 TRINITY_DN1290_c0_g1_i2:41-2176(-)